MPISRIVAFFSINYTTRIAQMVSKKRPLVFSVFPRYAS